MRPIGPMLPGEMARRKAPRHQLPPREAPRPEMLNREMLNPAVLNPEVLPGGPSPRPGPCWNRSRSGGR
jgi:hypothetical protein